MSIEGRVAALERMGAEAGPLVVYGEPTPMQRLAIEQAARDGRTVVRWPIAPPPRWSLIEQKGST